MKPSDKFVKRLREEVKMSIIFKDFSKLFLILVWVICIILSIINHTDFCVPLAVPATTVYLLIRN